MSKIKLNHITDGSGLTLCGKEVKDLVPDKPLCVTCAQKLLKNRNDLSDKLVELKEILRGLADGY